jgi:hypothetical protein
MNNNMKALVDLRDALLDVVFSYRFDTVECDEARAKVDAFDAAHPEALRAWKIINGGEVV